MLGIINTYTYFENLMCWLNSDYRFEISGPDLDKNTCVSLSSRRNVICFVAQCYPLSRLILSHVTVPHWGLNSPCFWPAQQRLDLEQATTIS